MDFNPEQRLGITKYIIEFTDPSRSCGLVNNRLGRNRSGRNNKFEDDMIVLYDNEQ